MAIARGAYEDGGNLLFPAAHLGKQNHLGKETGRVAEVRLVFPEPTRKRDGVVRFQFDLTGIGDAWAYALHRVERGVASIALNLPVKN